MTATTEPSRVTAGDTVEWARTLDDYPASAGWTLSYTLINSSAKISLSSTASGDAHLVSVTAATSANWAAGTYAWQAVVTKTTQRYSVGSGNLVINANWAAATTYDSRSTAKKTLEAVDAALLTYGAKAYLQSYEISGRSQRFHTPGEFLAFRSRLQAEVAREDNAARIAAGLAPRNQINVRFNSR